MAISEDRENLAQRQADSLGRCQIHVMSHVVHYGSSVLRGSAATALPSGPAIFRRAGTRPATALFLPGSKKNRIDVDYTREEISLRCGDVVANNNVWPCYLGHRIARLREAV